MQVLSFAEDITSPFAAGSRVAVRQGAVAGRVRSPVQLGRWIWSATSKRSHFDSEEGVRRFTDCRRAQQLRGPEAHGRLEARSPATTSSTAWTWCRASQPAIRRRRLPTERRRACSRSTSSTRTRDDRAGRRTRSRTRSRRSRWCRRRKAGAGCSLSLGGGVQRRRAAVAITGTSTRELQCAGAVSVLDRRRSQASSSTAPTRQATSAARSRSKRDRIPQSHSKAFNLAIATKTGSLGRAAAHRRHADAEGSADQVPDARRGRDAQPRLVRQLHREDPAEGRPARGLRRRRRSRESTAARSTKA